MQDFKYKIGQEVCITEIPGVRRNWPVIYGRGVIRERYSGVHIPSMLIPDWAGPSGGRFYRIESSILMPGTRRNPGIHFASEEELIGICSK